MRCFAEFTPVLAPNLQPSAQPVPVQQVVVQQVVVQQAVVQVVQPPACACVLCFHAVCVKDLFGRSAKAQRSP
jgi:hypothetical protein